MSGAVIERIRMMAFVLLAVALGSVVWILSASWGWHYAGWMVTSWGYHDFGASGVVHIIAKRLEDHSVLLGALETLSRDFR